MAVSRLPKGNTVPVDPDVIVPPAVKRAAEAAAELQKQMYPEQNPDNIDPNAPPQHKTQGESQAESKAEEEDRIKLAEPEPPTKLPNVVTTLLDRNAERQQEQQPVPRPAPQVSDNDESWKSKYEAQLGRNAPLHKQNKELADRINALETLIETRTAPPAASQPRAPEKLITSQEEEDFGTEMIDVMRRAAKEATSPLLEEINSLRSQLGSTTASLTRSSRQEMLSTLDSSLPDWRDINLTDEFKAWLALPDAFSGVTRKTLLQAAYDKNETSRVSAFFRSFISELAATNPGEGDQTPVATTTPAPAAKSSRPTLKDFTAPGRARTAASASPPAEKPIIRTSDINALYAAKRKGQYNGREAEFAEYERELELAQREGRVVRDT